jgi:hypothetical protein
MMLLAQFLFCHSGALRSSEPGIQNFVLSLHLDSGPSPSGCPGMTVVGADA